MEYCEFRAMNSAIVLGAEGEPSEVERGFEFTRGWIQAQEQRFTRFSETSELAALNRRAGGWAAVSDELFEIVATAFELHRQTQGLFDPTILDALERAGYDKSMDELRRYGAGEQKPSARRAGTFGEVQFDAQAHAICLPRGVRLDLGGIAKGWIAEHAAEHLAAYSRACAVSAGGDMVLIGLPEGQAAWEVDLEDPRTPDLTLAQLRVGPGAVATSSVTKRRWQQGDKTQHHLIDPRTQQPAITDWLAVTVIAAHAVTAETFAKGLLIAGPHEAENIAADAPDLDYIAVDQDGRLWGSPTAARYLEVNPVTA